MFIFPAIDLLSGKAVRLLKGDYEKVTVYSEKPIEKAKEFEDAGCGFLHVVDLDGAKSGKTDNLKCIEDIAHNTSLFIEVGGGIRDMAAAEKYINAGVQRIILGTAAVEDEEFLKAALTKYKEKVAVGVDIKDGYVAVKGWTEKSQYSCLEFCEKMQSLGVKTIICTDISKDGALKGTNLTLYNELSSKLSLDITASGGVSSIEDIKNLRKLNLYGAIIGKAYYEGLIDLKEALEAAK